MVDSKAVKEGAEAVNRLHELVGGGIEHEQIPVGDVGVLDDVDDVAEGEDVVVADRVFPGVKGDQVAVGLSPAARELRAVVRFKRRYIEPAAAHLEGTRILGSNRKRLHHAPPRHVDHGDPILGREGDIGLGVIGEGDPHRLIEAGGVGERVEVLDRGHDVEQRGALRSGVDHAHRVGDVVGDPHLPAVGTGHDRHRLDANRDPADDAPRGNLDDVERIGGSVGDEQMPPNDRQRIDMGGEKPGMADAGEGVGGSCSSKQRCRGKEGQHDKTCDRRADEDRPQRIVLHQPLLREKNRRGTGTMIDGNRGNDDRSARKNAHPTES